MGQSRERILNSLEWRGIGPHRGGRVIAVAADPHDPATFYFGSTGGGVWKSTDAGQFWVNVSDGYFQRASVGALAIAPSDPNVLYAGMGESTIRGNVSHGDGVYKSTDAGQSWQHLGLEQTRGIGRVRVHPGNPDLVYVAASGHAHGTNPERGLYRSSDGGRTWEQRLFVSDAAGAVNLSLDPTNPRRLYVAFWQGMRGPYFMSSGGPSSGLYRSDDGGETFTNLSEAPGFPSGIKGKIVSASAARPGRVWAIIEHDEQPGVYRSDDYGAHWQRLSTIGDLLQRAWYYAHIVADPCDAETVWVLNLHLWRSTDGGATFQQWHTPHGDHHDLWIDPTNPRRMILGEDGGAGVSLNAGESWSTFYNQPTAEMYHVTTDTRTPYRVYGAQQDNMTISVPSRSDNGAIAMDETYRVAGGESGYIVVRPDNPDIVYAGDQQARITRYNHASGETRDISVWPEHYWGLDAKDRKVRFAWTFPIVLSPHDPGVLYTGGNQVFRTTDEGHTWQAISPDLTRNDPSRLQPNGRIGENANGDVYGTVFALAESALQRGLLWAGSDDGLVHISYDGGEHWSNITPAGLPEWSCISIIEPSPHDPASAYLAATRHKSDDFRPWLFRTSDGGSTWQQITDGLPHDAQTRVIRSDPTRPGLLYAGTETGVYVSFNDGAGWERINGHLPVTPIHDLVVKDDDLVVATHGRSFWIFDELPLLRQLAELPAAPHLFCPPTAVRWAGAGRPDAPAAGIKAHIFTGSGIHHYIRRPGDEPRATFLDAGDNPPDGVVIHYLLDDSAAATPLTLTIRDSAGDTIRTFSSIDTPASLPAKPGLNRLLWNLRHPDPNPVTSPGGDRLNGVGAKVPPGDYSVDLNLGATTLTQPLTIVADPRSSATPQDLQAQYSLHRAISAKQTEVNAAIERIRALRSQAETWRTRSNAPDVTSAADRLLSALQAVEDELIQTAANNMEDTLRIPGKLNAKLAWLSWTISGGDFAPTTAHHTLYTDLAARCDTQLAALHALEAGELAVLNSAIAASGVAAVG